MFFHRTVRTAAADNCNISVANDRIALYVDADIAAKNHFFLGDFFAFLPVCVDSAANLPDFRVAGNGDSNVAVDAAEFCFVRIIVGIVGTEDIIYSGVFYTNRRIAVDRTANAVRAVNVADFATVNYDICRPIVDSVQAAVDCADFARIDSNLRIALDRRAVRAADYERADFHAAVNLCAYALSRRCTCAFTAHNYIACGITEDGRLVEGVVYKVCLCVFVVAAEVDVAAICVDLAASARIIGNYCLVAIHKHISACCRVGMGIYCYGLSCVARSTRKFECSARIADKYDFVGKFCFKFYGRRLSGNIRTRKVRNVAFNHYICGRGIFENFIALKIEVSQRPCRNCSCTFDFTVKRVVAICKR